ncbi:MAG: glycosyltransferase family 39 protein [Anaerolineales bacterium]|nr:glycosyltransferase family 39 protein [Anaerolineales bacterium]MDW8161995.1 glycosyltransferase family 39 protein [Anaerolineales bacterium]
MVYLRGSMHFFGFAVDKVRPDRLARHWKSLAGVLAVNVGLAFSLAYLSNRFQHAKGWENFLVALLLASLLLWGGWQLLRREQPPLWLGGLLIGAAALRLTLGALWFLLLPIAGFGSPAERSGYVMADAYSRDRVAWRAAQSDVPLSKLLTGRVYRKVDQYGGLLALSTAYYRLLGGEVHRPLLMVVLAAAFSALAVIFTWGAAKIALGDRVAVLAAGFMAFYPEAVLLGSSQMREAFLIPLVALSLYGLFAWLYTHRWQGVVLCALGLLFTYPFSPPSTALVLFTLVCIIAISGDRKLLRRKPVWLAILSAVVLIALGLWFSWGRFAPDKHNNPFSIATWWFRISAGLQTYLSIQDSGWMQKIARPLPEWARFALVTLYGVSRPLLPAALIAQSAKPFWQAMAIWRAIGWTILLPLLILAPLLALRRCQVLSLSGRQSVLALSVAVWVGILVASMRGGADLWDNPRYRAMLAAPQVLLAAWVWVSYRQRQENWIKHGVVGLGLVLLWFVPWYLRRYAAFAWPVSDFFLTLGLGLISAIIYWGIAWWTGRNRFRKPSNGAGSAAISDAQKPL